jgi:hypothetical protein
MSSDTNKEDGPTTLWKRKKIMIKKEARGTNDDDLDEVQDIDQTKTSRIQN